jgi:hypothetical protein
LSNTGLNFTATHRRNRKIRKNSYQSILANLKLLLARAIITARHGEVQVARYECTFSHSIIAGNFNTKTV